jgi:type IX secretion system PorP/SprF family membrane protein
MNKIQTLMIFVLFFGSCVAFAQQDNTFTMYRYQMNIFNPAYVGLNGETEITSSIRTQWTGIEDAPETQTISFRTTLGKNLGVGITTVSDKTFIEHQKTLNLDFSYKLKMNESSDLYFGIKAGGNFYDVNTSGIQTYNLQSDPALASINSFTPNIGVGLLFKEQKWYVSLSAPKLLNTLKAVNDAGYVTLNTNRTRIFLSGGYDFNLSPSLILSPSVFINYINGLPTSVDFNSTLNIENVFEFGATYRTEDAFSAMSTINISKRFMFGFAYEISSKPVLARARNTNEILFKFKF